MGIFSFIESAFRSEPKGPYCTMDNLKHDWSEYDRHIRKARELLFSTLSDERWTLVCKAYDGTVSPPDLLSDIRWKYLPIVTGWIADEFIPKIQTYSSGAIGPSEKIMRTDTVIDHGDRLPVMDAENHIVASRNHSSNILDELHFFFTDTRSPFRQKESLYGGDASPRELCRWYVGGKNIVKSNMERIDANLTAYIAFAKQNGAK